MKHILLPVLDDARTRVVTQEVLEVEEVPEGLLLLHSPALVEGLAGGDIIREDPSSESGFALVHRGRNLAVLVSFPSPEARALAVSTPEPDLAAVRAVCDGGPGTTLVFTVPVSSGFPAVEAAFTGLRNRYPGAEWYFNNVYGPDGQPEGWWTEGFAGGDQGSATGRRTMQ